MPTQKQRREAARRHLERQLAARQEREARRKRVTLVASIVATLAVIALVGVLIAINSGSDKKPNVASGATKTATTSPTTGTSTSTALTCGQAVGKTIKVHPATGKAVTFMGVTVKGAADLTGKPVVTAHNTKAATKLAVKDLVVGKGKTATPTSCVTIQYDGVLFKNGTEFDSSWSRATTAQFSLTGVVPGFTQGIGGTTGVAPMKVGGRRLIVVPAKLGYGSQAQAKIPANSTLVFIVDLVSIDALPAPAS